MATFSFSSKGINTSNTFDVIPAGKYNVEIIDSAIVATKANDGHYLKLTFSIIEGDYAGRYIWLNLNIDNANPKAVEIAQKQLAQIMKVCDIEELTDTNELHGVPMSAQVKIKPAQGEYAASNTLSGFAPPIEAGETEETPW